MSRIVTMRLCVPRWDLVEVIDDSEERMPSDPAPDLQAACSDAMDTGQLLVALHEADDEARPYAISGADAPYYAFRSPPTSDLTIPGVGKVVARYGFFPHLPEQVDADYDYDPEAADFQVFIDDRGRVGLYMESGEHDQKHMLGIGDDGDPWSTMLMRIVAIVHVLDALDGIKRSDVLPYHVDTPVIAHQRIAHILRWQFKNSRTRPLFA